MKKSILKIEIGNIIVKVILQGYRYNENLSYSPKHNHASFEFHIVGKGFVKLETDKGTLKLLENDSVLIHPEVFHAFKSLETGAVVLTFLFFIEKSKKKTAVDYYSLVEQRLKSDKGVFLFLQNFQIKECSTKILTNLYSESVFADERVKSWLNILLTEIFGVLNDNKTGTYENNPQLAETDMRFFIIEDYFNEHYMEDISLKKLAERLFLSEKQTDRMIKKAFGEGFRQHLCKIRLLISKDLLTDTDKEISEIAEQVGYKSYNGFYLAFKENVKMTPNEYRVKYKNKVL
ncbi:MAG: helix-turn-helix domain-containing protein [Clostridia bacterium]|nr:helix-turn-helix domain-containing protein [Clostridia bacterium]